VKIEVQAAMARRKERKGTNEGKREGKEGTLNWVYITEGNDYQDAWQL